MSKFKVTKEDLSTFLKLISLSSSKDIKNTECILEVKKDQIKSLIVSSDRILAVSGTLKGSFSEKGQVGVTDLESFEKYVNSMDSEFTADFSDNKLVLQSKSHKISVVLQNPDYIQNKLEPEKFKNISEKSKSGFSFTLTQNEVLELIKKFETLSSQDLVLESNNDGCLVLYVKDYKTENELYYKTEVADLKNKTFSIQVSRNFISILKTISNDLTLYLSNDETRNSIGISTSSDKYEVEYQLALKIKTIETTSETKTKKSKKNDAVSV